MNYLLIGGIILDVILLFILCLYKKDKLIWNILLCLSLLPLIFLATHAIGWLDIKDIKYGIVTSILLFFLHWYFYVPAMCIFIVSLYKVNVKK